MFPGFDLRVWDQMVVLGLDRSDGHFARLFSKIQDVQERFKTLDVKELTIMFSNNACERLMFSNFVPL